MVEDLGCPRSFAEGLLKSIADNFKDGTTVGKTESSYSSRHASTPEHERGAQEIVIKNEREVRKASSELMKDLNKKIEVETVGVRRCCDVCKHRDDRRYLF